MAPVFLVNFVNLTFKASLIDQFAQNANYPAYSVRHADVTDVGVTFTYTRKSVQTLAHMM